MIYDVITFGSATFDIILYSKEFLVKKVKDKKFITGQGIFFPFPSKVNLEKIYFFTGGGGTNVAASLASQGFKVAYCGIVGKDLAGKEIISDLKKFRVETKFVFQTKAKPTNHSIVIVANKDRTCLVFRGASELLTKKLIPWSKLRAKWFYLAPLSGKLAFLFDDLVNFAKKNKIKVFANPGHSQLKLGLKRLKPILEKIDILLLNQEEASFLTKIPYQKEREIFKKIDEFVPGIFIMTKGREGAVVSDNKNLWRAKPKDVKVLDKTGAGDAFGSGFLAGILKKGDIEFALQMAIANASACLQKIGAKEGILRKGEKFEKVKIKKEKLK